MERQDNIQEKSSLGHMPEGEKWEFDQGVVDCFDDMLERSIPGYRRMRDLVVKIGKEYVVPKYDVLDLGASRGEAIDPFIKKFGAANKFTLIEVSPPMLGVLRERYRFYSDAGVVEIQATDLREDYPPVRACLTLSVLTLQFTPIEHRLRLLSSVYSHTIPGGAFVLVEKLLGGDPITDGLFGKIYRDYKHENGYSYEEIDRKRLSLEGRLVPVSEDYNKDMLKRVGFRSVETFWRDMNFCGILAVK